MESNIKLCSVKDTRIAVYSNPDFQLVDVREKSEYDTVRIVNSKLVPLSSFEESCSCISKDKPVYLLCGAGKRAMKAAELLELKGYKDLFVIDGGIKAWIDAGYSVVR